jgi:hypothetical protein
VPAEMQAPGGCPSPSISGRLHERIGNNPPREMVFQRRVVSQEIPAPQTECAGDYPREHDLEDQGAGDPKRVCGDGRSNCGEGAPRNRRPILSPNRIQETGDPRRRILNAMPEKRH